MKEEINFINRKLIFDIRSDADQSVLNEIFGDREYRIVEDVIKKASHEIIDVGAHIGVFSIYASVLNPNVKIFAFEPEEANVALLKGNLKLNNIQNVVVRGVAVGAEDGLKDFFVSADSHNHSFFDVNGSLKKIKVQVQSFGKILQKAEIVDLVKMDSEGAEFEILNSLSAEDFAKVRAFYIEYHEYSPEMKAEELIKLIQRNGFKTKSVSSRYDKRMGFIFAERKTS